MRPIALKGHERAITYLKYNADGDLLFTSAKDAIVTVWYTHNGERLGTFDGHKGAIWTLDVSSDSKRLLTGAADKTARLWEVETGRELAQWGHDATIRCVSFAHGNERFCAVTDKEMKRNSTICVYQLVDLDNKAPLFVIEDNPARVHMCVWSPMNDQLVSCADDGLITVWSSENGSKLKVIKEHDRSVNKLQYSQDNTLLISASSDHTAKLFDAQTYQVLKTYKSDKPLNTASISPLMEQVIAGGGQEAAGVTTSAAQSGKFETIFFHEVYEDEIGSLKGHFGPIHILQFAPDGKGFASGSEDGFVRLHHFDPEYFTTNLD